MTAGAQGLSRSGDRLLTELVGGIAGGLEGRSVSFKAGGRPVRAVLDRIRLRRIGERHEVLVELVEVDVGGWPMSFLSVVAPSVRIRMTPAPRLEISGVEIAGRSSLTSFVPWLDAHVPGWTLRLDDNGFVEATRAPGRLAITVDPVVRDGHLDAELRALRLGGLRVTVPSRLRLVRRLALPALPWGARVTEAHRRGGDVEFRATSRSLREELDLGRLRDAIQRLRG